MVGETPRLNRVFGPDVFASIRRAPVPVNDGVTVNVAVTLLIGIVKGVRAILNRVPASEVRLTLVASAMRSFASLARTVTLNGTATVWLTSALGFEKDQYD